MGSAIALNALYGLANMDLGPGAGVGRAALVTGAEFGAGFALGEVYHRFQDKPWGRHIGTIAGAVGKFGAVVSQMITGGEPTLVGGLLNAVGSAGVAIAGCELGLMHARNATGRRAVLLKKGAPLPDGGVEATIGALPPAQPGGKALSWEQLEELAAMH